MDQVIRRQKIFFLKGNKIMIAIIRFRRRMRCKVPKSMKNNLKLNLEKYSRKLTLQKIKFLTKLHNKI